MTHSITPGLQPLVLQPLARLVRRAFDWASRRLFDVDALDLELARDDLPEASS